MFFKLKFGYNEEMLFNSYCYTQSLIESIRKRCELEPNLIIDLADEYANIKGISEQPATEYASSVLQPRCSYVLVQVKLSIDERTGDVIKTYSPLLEDLEKTNPEFLARLTNTKSNHDISLKGVVGRKRKKKSQGRYPLMTLE